MKKRFRTAGMVLAGAVLIVPTAAAAAPAELPDLPDHAAEKVAAAHAKAAKAAGEMKGEGRGLDPERARGVARAKEVSNSWRFTDEVKPGEGKGPVNSQGRAQDVHAALAAGQSPSELGPHSQDVSERAKGMAKAFTGLKTKWDGHPGKGQGKGLGGPGGGEDDADD